MHVMAVQILVKMRASLNTSRVVTMMASASYQRSSSRPRGCSNRRSFSSRLHLVCHSSHTHPNPPVSTAREFAASLKLDSKGLCTALAQDVDTGAVMMAAFATPEAVEATLTTGHATFYSRSRQELWVKGGTSGNYINVERVHYDCDRDCVIYLGVPDGPSCHTGEKTCFFSEVVPTSGEEGGKEVETTTASFPHTTLFSLQETIKGRKRSLAEDVAKGQKSWTSKLLGDKALLCQKVREEADELCRALEDGEGGQRVASEMADLLYHSMVLMASEGVDIEEAFAVLRKREGVSGIVEKASRRS